jgi:urease accessory protein
MNAPVAAPSAARAQRSRGRLEVGVRTRDGRAAVRHLRMDGALRARMPRPAVGTDPEVILINTAGGMTGGDDYRIDVEVDAGAALTVAGQACEKVYRSAGGSATLRADLRVGAGARCLWLPQPAILFQDAAFTRRLEIDLDPGAELLAVEATVLGRAAMGERVTRCRLREDWRLRIGGRLAWAAATRLDDAAVEAAAPSTLAGGCAVATLVHVAADPAAARDALRAALEGTHGRAGASDVDGVVVAQLVAPDADRLMTDLVRVLTTVLDRPVPRVWTC